MKATNLRLAAKLLRLAAEEFGNHGCNDFDLAAVVPDVETRRRLMLAYHRWNGDPQEWDPKSEYKQTFDFMLMGFLAGLLEKAAAAEEILQHVSDEFRATLPIRELAVLGTDAKHGYTYEFAPSPTAHRDEYDRAEEVLKEYEKVKDLI